MKARVIKKRINRYINEFSRKIPKAFKTGRERREWVKNLARDHFLMCGLRQPRGEE